MTWSEFFAWGENPSKDVEADIFMGLTQDKDTLYFLGDYTANASSIENSTSRIYIDLLIRYSVARFFAIRNTLVDNGSFLADYRAFVSQNGISIKNKNGEKTIQIIYIKSIDIFENPRATILEKKI